MSYASAAGKTYAGIGSQETPRRVQDLMTEIAARLAMRGYRLRSGGAPGADRAFERGAPPGQRDIFLPYEGWLGHSSPLFHVPELAQDLAARYHPAPRAVRKSRKNRLLLGRDVQQVLGVACNDPCQFVICWTPDGADGVDIPTSRITRGTGQAIRVAAAHRIPVFNLARPEMLIRIANGLGMTLPEDLATRRIGLICR